MEQFIVDNPFVVLEEFAKNFVLSCRKMLIKHLILKGTEKLEEMTWRYVGKGVVEYSYSDTVHHPAGYHEMGTLGMVTFASFSAWEERVRTSHDWNVILDCPAGKENEHLSGREEWYEGMIKFMDVVFANEPASYKRLTNEVMPAFNRIKKYW